MAAGLPAVGGPAPPVDRVAALDGLRGITIVLVVLAHGWLLWPLDEVTRVPVLRGVFLGGTVTVFFVVGGFVVTRGLLNDLDRGSFDPLRFYLRRIARLGPQLVLVCLAVVCLDALDATAVQPGRTRPSVLHVLTFTWNTFLEQEPLRARADLGHLWYLSVQQQVYLVLPLFLLLFASARRLAALLVAAGIVGVVVLRYHWHRELGYWPVSLRTLTRADGLLVGVLVGVTMPWLARAATTLRWAVPGGLLAMVVLVLTSGEVGAYQYLRWWGVAVMIASGVLVAGIAHPSGSRALRVLSLAPLAGLGRASYSLYVWHYPLFWFMSAHAGSWHWLPRTATALGALAVIAVVMERFVEQPVRTLLARPGLFRLPSSSRDPEQVAA